MDYYIESSCFDLKQTLESGQCFRWRRVEDGLYCGAAGRHILSIRQEKNGVTLLNTEESELDFWLSYFDCGTDYEAIIEQFSADEILKAAADENRGIRILRQEPFETLISFIISQNNNIPRITGIIDRLCSAFGERLEYTPRVSAGGAAGRMYSFPDAKTLASLTAEELSVLRAGFRVRYILDAAEKVRSGQIDLKAVYDMSYEQGREYLKQIVGVGDKVADCVLLFAYHKTEAFPSDVWIKRIVAQYYSDGLPECMGGYKGIAQQYLFEYFRKRNDPREEDSYEMQTLHA